MHKVLISGYFGMGNGGDEALLSTLLQLLEELGEVHGEKIQALVLSGDPEATQRLHKVQAFKRWDVGQILTGIRGSDFVITGPGGLIQDATSLRSLCYYVGIATLAKVLDKESLVFACGVGPIQTKIGGTLVRRLFKDISHVSVRDPGSVRVLAEAGVKRGDVNVMPDIGVLFQGSPLERGVEILRCHGVYGRRPLVVVTPRPSDCRNDLESLLAATADAIIHEYGADLIFIPFDLRMDLPFCRAIQSRMERKSVLIEGVHDPRELKALVGQGDLLVGMRLHSLVFGYTYGIPLVGISYDPKVEAFLTQIGAGDFLSVEDLSEEGLLELIRRAMGADGPNYQLELLPIIENTARTQAHDFLTKAIFKGKGEECGLS